MGFGTLGWMRHDFAERGDTERQPALRVGSEGCCSEAREKECNRSSGKTRERSATEATRRMARERRTIVSVLRVWCTTKRQRHRPVKKHKTRRQT
jgi:hypothetical protein